MNDPCEQAATQVMCPKATNADRLFVLGAYCGFTLPIVFAIVRCVSLWIGDFMHPDASGMAECGTAALGMVGLVVAGPPSLSLLLGFVGWLLGGAIDRFSLPR